MAWLKILLENGRRLNNAYVANDRGIFIRDDEQECLSRKKKRLEDHQAKIVKTIMDGQVFRVLVIEDICQADYIIHLQHLIKQKDKFYLEEKIEERRAIISGNELIDDYCLLNEKKQFKKSSLTLEREDSNKNFRFEYDRLEAVRYAERWWNDYNPIYIKFENNCTNFISQCLHAGGAPMIGFPNRNKGWWYRENNWSFSWAVAHSFRWYLSGSKMGLRAKEVANPEELIKGDVICYDFDGDGRWQHTTIVVKKDENNMPLVNAQTTNSRMRYWAYEDSTAWTPNIKYKFFHIIDR